MAVNPTLEDVKNHLDKATEHLYPKNLNDKGEPHNKGASLSKTLVELQAAVTALAEYINRSETTAKDADDKKDDTGLSERIRKTEDELDDEKQKNLKGKFMLISSDKVGKESHIKTDDAIEHEKKTLVGHVSDLVFRKYKFKIPAGDFSSCYRLYTGGIIFSLWNQQPGSAYNNLCGKIKSRESLDVNIFFNFMLTKRRSTLLYETRVMKRTGRIDKFFSDESGTISVKVGAEKQKIAGLKVESTGEVKTFTLEELQSKYPVTVSAS